ATHKAEEIGAGIINRIITDFRLRQEKTTVEDETAFIRVNILSLLRVPPHLYSRFDEFMQLRPV
ncbi:MAG: hypothetical protein V2I33_21335, partial [Kangiellaceae bacterium]|nr:hypothetical protein [Kangiellaceae bacterium]